MVRSFLNVSAFLNYSEAHFGVTCHIGHIMRTQKSPEGKPWFWTIFAGAAPGMVCDRGYAATREQALADFEAEWLRLSVLKTKEPRNQSGRSSLLIRDQKDTQPVHTIRVVSKM